MATPFWIQANPEAIARLNQRWHSAHVQRQLKNPYHRVVIDGRALPGLVKLKKVRQKLTVHGPKAAGKDGNGRPTIRGRENPDYEIDMMLYTEEHLRKWDEIRPTLNVVEHPTDRDEHYVDHPLLALNQIGWCIVIGYDHETPEPGDGMPVKIFLLGCQEKPGGTKAVDRPAKNAALSAKDTPAISLPQAQRAPLLTEPRSAR